MSAPRTPSPLEAANVPASATPTAPATAAEAASRSPGHAEASLDPHPLFEVAASLLARLKPFLSEPHIEVEARLCSIGQPQKRARENTQKAPVGATPTLIPSRDAPRIVEDGRRRIQVGVSAEDFARMKAHVAEEAEALPFQQSVTEDVITKTGRYTYVVAEDGSESFVGCIAKRRLCNIEVLVPGCPYDVRVSISTEVPKAATSAPAVKPQGYVRRKRRWTATAESFEYAFTRVGADGQQCPSFEVEIEGVHANSQAGVTEAWLADLLRRLLALARLKGNTGLPQKPARGEHQ
ncbi:RNA triphosphatase, putative [Leishmania donovani]|uniref:mRNA 5'-phosphatase n=1 Tax=Leishmania donovani TaxID=5661 RepID=A0A3S7WZD5_LEIDO|nr:RNA triphosphatase, putative [Leishmania donovani]AYU79555.1 RNA triphosphatase, putative [Leishmania donovani]TPP40816.1 mRNA capping enzyme, beta chain family protein [Leishmania donovani]CBZ34848.1 RNA triphosphatase, putative [Leishmania donovani]